MDLGEEVSSHQYSLLYNYVNDVIAKLSRTNHRFRIGDLFWGCMYSDDLILISAALCNHDRHLHYRISLESLDLTLNVKKSQVTRIGPSFCAIYKMISVNDVFINYVEKLKYLPWFLCLPNLLKLVYTK